MDYFLRTAEVLCYICDGKTGNSCEKLISKFTKTTCISFPKMISTLISDEFVLVVGKEDVVCDQCTFLVNKMDELQTEILAVRKSLSEFLSKKYQIPISDPLDEVKQIHTLKEDGKKSVNDTNLSENFELKHSHVLQEVFVRGLKNKTSPRRKDFKFECSYCFKLFSTKENLKKHVKICKPENVAPVTVGLSRHANSENDSKASCNIQNDKIIGDDDITSFNENNISQNDATDTLSDENGTEMTYFMCELCNSLLKNADDFNNHSCQQLENSDNNGNEIISFKDVLTENDSTQNSDKDDSMIEITIENLLEKDSNINSKTSLNPKVILTCYICDSVMRSRSELARHILNHYPVKTGDSAGKGITCPVCDANFMSLINFMNHYDIHVKSTRAEGKTKEPASNRSHNAVTTKESEKNLEVASSSVHYPCNFCQKCYQSYHELNEHLKMHNINTCQYCRKNFPSDLKLKEHLVIHEAKVKTNQCEYCLLRFNSAKELEIHSENVHDQIKTNKSCPLCRKKCASGFSVKRHIIKSHLIPVLQQEIREKYSQGSDLVDDMKSLGASEKFIKSISSISGTNEVENNINNFKMIVNIEASDVNFCLICGFSSKSVANLDKHREKHSIRKIPCPLFCEFLSCDTDELSTHLTESHELVLSTEYCPHCLCQPDEDINLHMKALHGKFYAHLTCHICKEMFFSKENLKYHFSVAHLILTDQQFEEKGASNIDLDENSVEADNPKENGGEDSAQEEFINSELTAALKTITHDPTEGSDTLHDIESSEGVKFISETSQACVIVCGDEIRENTKKICVICRKECKTEEDLSKHVSKHSAESENIDCPLCTESIHDSVHLRLHMLWDHPSSSQNFCFACKQSFSSRSGFIKHLTSNCSNRTCELCSKHFVNISAFIHHRTYGHRKDLKCIHCKKSCKSLKHLKYHEKLHLKYKGKVFKCNECGKTFQTPNSLKTHSISHTGNYPFVCEFCGRGFISSYGLSEHRASHTGDIRYCCEICGKSFRLYDTYHRHRRQHDDPFPAQCCECGKRFRNSSRVAEHRRKVHTGERPYVCPYCSKTFNVTSSYRIHMCKHTQVFPYNCNLCNRGFPTRYKYGNHLATHHNDYSHQIKTE